MSSKPKTSATKNVEVANNPEIDPTLPKVEINFGDQSYFLCFTFGALALAASKLRSIGINVNVLKALDLSSLDADQVVPLLFAGLITHQPKIDFETVASLVTFRNLPSIFEGIGKAYIESLTEPSDHTEPEGNEQGEE
jgi:hypothetical protein